MSKVYLVRHSIDGEEPFSILMGFRTEFAAKKGIVTCKEADRAMGALNFGVYAITPVEVYD